MIQFTPAGWWAWARKNKTMLAAAVLTGGEAAVNLGLPLPGSDLIPAPLRGLAILTLGAFAFYFRWKAQREQDRGE